MIRSAVGKVMWVGRATVFLLGVAVILALVFGAVSTVSAHTGERGFFHLGHNNVKHAMSKLVGRVAGPSLVIGNGSEDPRATALRLNVKSGKAPMKVNAAAGKATNLNADKLDNKDSNDFAPQAVEAWRVVGATDQPGFQNGWINFGGNHTTTAFYKDPWGVVHLKGVVKGGTVAAHTGGTVFVLPCGYGPNQDEVHAVLSNEAVGRVNIRFALCGSGLYAAHVIAWPPSNNAWVSLDGITFRAAGS